MQVQLEVGEHYAQCEAVAVVQFNTTHCLSRDMANGSVAKN